MEIPEKGPLPSLPAQNRSTEALPPPSAEPTGAQPGAAPGDTVNLTESGREFKTAVQNARLLPDIREDRVMQLKRQLEEGTYRVKGRRIAVNMIDETLENNTILKHMDTKV